MRGRRAAQMGVRLQLLALAALAAAAPPRVELTYFKTRGLAEPIRLALHDAGVAFEEVVVGTGDRAEFGEVDWDIANPEGIASGDLPFGQVPRLSFKDEHEPVHNIVQSRAILQFVGRRYGYYSFGGERSDSVIDMVMSACEDISKAFSSKLVYNDDFEANKKQYFEEYMPQQLEFLDALLLRGGQKFFADRVSMADFMVFDILDKHTRVSLSLLDRFPKLRMHAARVASRPRLRKYLESSSRVGHNGWSGRVDSIEKPGPGADHLKNIFKQIELMGAHEL